MISNPEHKEGQVQKVKKEKSYKKYTVDLNSLVSNKLLSLEAASKYLQSNIKVGGLKNKLGDSVKVTQSDKKDKLKNSIFLSVDTTLKFSKRYIRYLMKKFLKREGIGRYLTIISTGPNVYTVKVLRKNEA